MTARELRRPELPHLSDEDVARIGAFYGISHADIILLKQADNLVYEGIGERESIIIRVSHAHRRNRLQVEAESNWLLTLADRGVAVAPPRPSTGGSLVEVMQVGEVELVVAAFDKVPGINPTNGRNAIAPWYECWGRVVGQMHAVASEPQHVGRSLCRPHWHQDPSLALAKLVPDQPIVIQRAEELIHHLNSLPTDSHCYGLIHGDLHEDNSHLHEGCITLYDFDDLHYGFFASDIAVVLYCARWYCPEQQSMNDYVRQLTACFLSGYRQEMTIDKGWLAQMPSFLELRRLVMYGNHYRNWDFESVSEERLGKLARHRKEIEDQVAMIEVDCSDL